MSLVVVGCCRLVACSLFLDGCWLLVVGRCILCRWVLLGRCRSLVGWLVGRWLLALVGCWWLLLWGVAVGIAVVGDTSDDLFKTTHLNITSKPSSHRNLSTRPQAHNSNCAPLCPLISCDMSSAMSRGCLMYFMVDCVSDLPRTSAH